MQFQNPSEWLSRYGHSVKARIMSLSEEVDIEYVQKILIKYVISDKEYNEANITEKLSQVEMIAKISVSIEDFELNCLKVFNKRLNGGH